MDFLGQRVTHSKYGDGEVLSRSGETFEVAFPGAGAKKFIYPNAFEAFLTFTDPAAQAKVQAELCAARETLAAQRQQREQESLQRQSEQRRAQLAQRRTAAARVKKTATATRRAAAKKTEE